MYSCGIAALWHRHSCLCGFRRLGNQNHRQQCLCHKTAPTNASSNREGAPAESTISSTPARPSSALPNLRGNPFARRHCDNIDVFSIARTSRRIMRIVVLMAVEEALQVAAPVFYEPHVRTRQCDARHL